ncbi:MAG: triose-phosphate isomerase, partial [Rhodospirillales bacterium]|nr:triose-phosphate isomerase [Rhodospirillales bacterium]
MKARRPLIAGNWKMNGLKADGIALAQGIAAKVRETAPACDLLVCPPFTLVSEIARAVAGTPVAVGGQDCHARTGGAHTGDIAAAMLADAGCSHVIVGHSE